MATDPKESLVQSIHDAYVAREAGISNGTWAAEAGLAERRLKQEQDRKSLERQKQDREKQYNSRNKSTAVKSSSKGLFGNLGENLKVVFGAICVAAVFYILYKIGVSENVIAYVIVAWITIAIIVGLVILVIKAFQVIIGAVIGFAMLVMIISIIGYFLEWILG